MVTVYIGGGLANKMFQYAFSLAIKKRGYKVCYDTYTFKSEFQHDQVTLQSVFPHVEIAGNTGRNHYVAGHNGRLARLWKRLSSDYVIEHAYRFNDKVWKQLHGECYVEGAWQDERYFVEASEEVRIAFSFSAFEDEKNKKVVQLMERSNSVAIHIRKGDGYGTWDIFRDTCPKEYYIKALEYVKKHVDNPTYFVFTDTPELVSAYLDTDDYTLVDWNPTVGKGNHWDMQLMNCAKHNIIANSTYSWWGAWLNNNPNKIVIAPEFWFNPKCKWAYINHIIPECWVKL